MRTVYVLFLLQGTLPTVRPPSVLGLSRLKDKGLHSPDLDEGPEGTRVYCWCPAEIAQLL